MGFPCVHYCILLPKPLAILVYFFDRVKLAVSLSLAYIGLRPPVGAQDAVHVELDLSLLPPFSKEAPSYIKTRLRVVEFASFCDCEEAECSVCMAELEARNEVRELSNCSHAFHKECIDKWVDMGQDTCPLCRARLVPYICERDRHSLISYS